MSPIRNGISRAPEVLSNLTVIAWIGVGVGVLQYKHSVYHPAPQPPIPSPILVMIVGFEGAPRVPPLDAASDPLNSDQKNKNKKVTLVVVGPGPHPQRGIPLQGPP
jgi:hypothetical protein